jgi:hypothetical protein
MEIRPTNRGERDSDNGVTGAGARASDFFYADTMRTVKDCGTHLLHLPLQVVTLPRTVRRHKNPWTIVRIVSVKMQCIFSPWYLLLNFHFPLERHVDISVFNL